MAIEDLESALIKADAAGNAEDAKFLADEIKRLRSGEGESTLGGMAAEAGKGIVRGISDTALAVPKAVLPMALGPVAGPLAVKGVEALAAPSREAFKAAPEGTGEKIAGMAGEFGGAILAPSLPGMAQKGAVLASKVVEPVVGPVGRTLRNLIDPLLPGGTERAVGRTLLKLAGEKRAPVMKALAEPELMVRGSAPTAAEAAAKAGSAEFSGAQRLAEQRLPTGYSDISKSQESARQAAVQSFGKSPQALETAIKNRTLKAKKLYEQASKQILLVDDELKTLLNTDSMKSAMKRVQSIETEFGKARPSPSGTLSVGKLHYLKMAMDDFIREPEKFGIAAAETEAITGTQKAFLKWLTSRSKSYDEARQAFAKASGEINVMQVGQQLEKSLTAPLGTAERPGPFATAMREAPKTIEKATGSPRFRNLEQAVGKENATVAQGILDDLARAAEQEKLGRAGVARAAKIVGEAVPGLPATGPLQQKYMIFKTIFNRFGGKLGEKELVVLADAMKTPKATLKLMQEAAAREALSASLRSGGKPITPLTPSQKYIVGGAAGAAELENRE